MIASHVRCVKANSHRHARHDKTVLSVSRPQWRYELHSGQLKTVADRKFEVWTRSEQSSNLYRPGTVDTTQTGPSCRVWCGGVNWVGPTARQVRSASECVGRRKQALPMRPPDALRRKRTCWAIGPTQFTPDTTRLPRLPVDRRRRNAGHAGTIA